MIRIETNNFLFCIQTLYQNGYIDADERKELSNLLQKCLSNETSANKHNLHVEFENIFYGKKLPMNIKELVYGCMNKLQ